MSSEFHKLSETARMAAETAETALQRVMDADNVILAGLAYLDAIEREAPAPELLELTGVFIRRARNYQRTRMS